MLAANLRYLYRYTCICSRTHVVAKMHVSGMYLLLHAARNRGGRCTLSIQFEEHRHPCVAGDDTQKIQRRSSPSVASCDQRTIHLSKRRCRCEQQVGDRRHAARLFIQALCIIITCSLNILYSSEILRHMVQKYIFAACGCSSSSKYLDTSDISIFGRKSAIPMI